VSGNRITAVLSPDLDDESIDLALSALAIALAKSGYKNVSFQRNIFDPNHLMLCENAKTDSRN